MKLFGEFFGDKRPWKLLEYTRGGLWGPLDTTYLHLYKYSKIPKTLGESRKYSFRRCKFRNHEIQPRGLFCHSSGGGNDHRGVLHHPCCLSDDA